MTIPEKILPKSFWESAYPCSECRYLLPKLSEDEHKEKKKALKIIRHKLAEAPYRNGQYKMCDGWDMSLLKEDGTFSDLSDTIDDALTALRRLACTFEKMRYSANNHTITTKQRDAILKSVIHYCDIELARTDRGASRFTNSVFALPTCTANIYMSMLPDMEAVEEGAAESALLEEAADRLLRCSLQCWTLPERGDHTDLHPISIERLRGHLWWESGNCLGYRLLFYTAVMFLSVEMMEAVVAASVKSFSVTSHNTNKESFWSEGYTADGMGWAHGRQPAFQSYPADGLRYTLFPLQYLRHTPWEKDITKIDFSVAVNFIRSSTWNQYKGHMAQPLTTRNMFANEKPDKMPLIYIDIAANLLIHFSDLLTEEQVSELRQLYTERYDLKMESQPLGRYMGVRYFYNNDILAKRTGSDYFMLHMASERSDGAEFCHSFADTRNCYASDGAYLIMKSGEEYFESKGAFTLCLMPGVTARYIENEKLLPGINWSGFHSVHNYAGGVFRGMNGAAGFIFEKDKKKSIDAAGVKSTDANPEVFDVIAYKGCFIFDKTVVCLGSAIKNLNTGLKGNIITSINQTTRDGDILYKTKDGIKSIRDKADCYEEILPEDCTWIKQGGILYGIYSDYTDGKVVISASYDRTNRHFLNSSNPVGEDIDIHMFRLYIDHSEAREEKRYAYLMYTGEDFDSFEINRKPVILSNTKQLQAVECGNVVQGVFYDKNAACRSSRFDIAVSDRTVLMLEADEDDLQLTVSDPTQNPGLEQLQISITDKLKGKTTDVTVKLPAGENIGKPVTVTVA